MPFSLVLQKLSSFRLAVKSAILFYSWSLTLLDTVLFMNPLNFVAVILKVLLVNLLAALNFANFF